MKNSKALIAALCAIVLIFSFAACTQQKAKTENVTQVVTNENGEAVTGENGEAITEEVEAQIVTDADGKAVTEVVTGSNGTPLTTVQNNKYVNVTQAVTVPYSGSGNKSAASKTENGKKSSGSNTTKKSQKTTKKGKKTTTTTTTTTKPTQPITRKIKIKLTLPSNNNKDTVIVTVNGDKVYEKNVMLDGSTFEITTEEKYTGEVEIKAYREGKDGITIISGDKECAITVPLDEIFVVGDDKD